MRVVSLVPAATEWLAAFGAGGLLVGRSHACDHPLEVQGLPVLTRPAFAASGSAAEIDAAVREAAASGPAVVLDADALHALRPDLVVTQDTCGVCAVPASALPNSGAEALAFSPGTFKEALDAALTLARRVGRLPDAMAFVAAAERDLAALRQRIGARRDGSLDGGPAPTVACVEWADPLMLAGHWVPDLVRLAGGEPLGPAAGERSPSLPMEELAALDPDVVVVAACGRTVAEARGDLEALAEAPGWQALRAVRADRVWLLDGNAYANRPGPRLYRTVSLLAAALHPDRVAIPHDPWECARWRAPVPA